MIFIRRVVGDSMLPTLKNKTVVLCRQTRSLREGQVVVAFINGREVIKRIREINDADIFIVGDNEAQSTDSRSYGPIGDQYIEGVVFWPNTKLQ